MNRWKAISDDAADATFGVGAPFANRRELEEDNTPTNWLIDAKGVKVGQATWVVIFIVVNILLRIFTDSQFSPWSVMRNKLLTALGTLIFFRIFELQI